MFRLFDPDWLNPSSIIKPEITDSNIGGMYFTTNASDPDTITLTIPVGSVTNPYGLSICAYTQSVNSDESPCLMILAHGSNPHAPPEVFRLNATVTSVPASPLKHPSDQNALEISTGNSGVEKESYVGVEPDSNDTIITPSQGANLYVTVIPVSNDKVLETESSTPHEAPTAAVISSSELLQMKALKENIEVHTIECNKKLQELDVVCSNRIAAYHRALKASRKMDHILRFLQKTLTDESESNIAARELTTQINPMVKSLWDEWILASEEYEKCLKLHF